MICQNCKSNIPDDSKFCPDCGTPVISLVELRTKAKEITIRYKKGYDFYVNDGVIPSFVYNITATNCEKIIEAQNHIIAKHQELEKEENKIRVEASGITITYAKGYTSLVKQRSVPNFYHNCRIEDCKTIIAKKNAIIKRNEEIENESKIRAEASRITTTYGVGYSYLVNIGYVPQYTHNCSITVCKAIIDKKDTIIKNHQEELKRIESRRKMEEERKLRQRADQIRVDCSPGLRYFLALFIMWGFFLSGLLFILAGLYILIVSKNYENGGHNMENMIGWGWFIGFFGAIIQHQRRYKKNIEDWKKSHSSDPSVNYL